MAKKFIVATTRGNSKEVISYSVLNANSELEISETPDAVVFPVSPVYDRIYQLARATDYAAYMNKVEEAITQAYEQNQLVNILKS